MARKAKLMIKIYGKKTTTKYADTPAEAMNIIENSAYDAELYTSDGRLVGYMVDDEWTDIESDL